MPDRTEREAASLFDIRHASPEAEDRADVIDGMRHLASCLYNGDHDCTCFVAERLERIEAAARAAGLGEAAEVLRTETRELAKRSYPPPTILDRMADRIEALS